jgi:hypothetical protein
LFVREVEADQRVAIRMRRQDRLSGNDGLRVSAIICEGALAQQTGGPDVQRKQLRHLINLLEQHRNIEVRVIPFKAPHGVILGGAAFHLLDFTDEQLPTVGWSESATFGSSVDDATHIRDMNYAYLRALGQALSQQESVELMARYAGG